MIEKENMQFVVLCNVYAQRFQTALELFKCGTTPLIFCGVSPNLQGEKPHTPPPPPPPHLPNEIKNVAATWYEGKDNNAGNI
jgi:hypothetical protein